MSADANPGCGCGSGLTSFHCCSLKEADIPPANTHGQWKPIVDQAVLLYTNGLNKSAAAQLCITALEQVPILPRALLTLGKIRREEGNLPAAEALFGRLAKHYPTYPEATRELGTVLLQRGKTVEASRYARETLLNAPLDALSHYLMGQVSVMQWRPHDAEHHFNEYLRLNGDVHNVFLTTFARSLLMQGRMDDARQRFEECDKLAPDNKYNLDHWAQMEIEDRQFGAAALLVDRMEALWPTDVDVLRLRATLLEHDKRYDEAIEVLDKSLEANPVQFGAADLMLKGTILDKMGEHHDAWVSWSDAKLRTQNARADNGFQERLEENTAQRLHNFFVAKNEVLQKHASVRTDLPQPIFIVGFPRSGTTLLDQTLSMHPHITAGGELTGINDLINTMPRLLNSRNYPEGLFATMAADTRDGLDVLRDTYLRSAGRRGLFKDETQWFTDKMPLNEMHLGLINMMFPESPVIHIVRHPLDILASTMSKSFFTSSGDDFEAAARHMVRIMNLVDHYRTEIPGMKYLRISYEGMVASREDQEATIRGVYNHIGIGNEFKPEYLEFWNNQAKATTVSSAQVAEPLNDRSVDRWRHYADELQPVIPTLEPLMKALGYEHT